MANDRPIPTPWRQHWLRIRYQLLPILVFGGTVLLTISLWRHHAGLPNAVGEVEVVTYDVIAPASGTLLAVAWTCSAHPDVDCGEPGTCPVCKNALAARQPLLYQKVDANQVVVRMDTTLLRRQIDTQQAQIEMLKAQVEEAKARHQEALALATVARNDQERDAYGDARRLAMDVERFRLAYATRQAEIAGDTVELQRQTEWLKEMEKSVAEGAESRWAYWNARMARDVIQERLNSSREPMAEAGRQLKQAEDARDKLVADIAKLPQALPPGLETVLAPIQADIRVQAEQIRELEAQLAAATIRTPVAGTICRVDFHAGQNVAAGQPILSIAAEGPDRHIIAYLREPQAVQAKVNMPVLVRIRTLPLQTIRGVVTEVGPRVEQIPRQHLGDPRAREWGLPIRIRIPGDTTVHPGELVDVTFGIAANH